MISDGSYQQFECALSHDRHFVKDPVILVTCGHFVCNGCFKFNKKPIVCKICNCESNDINDEVKEAKRSFTENLSNFYEILEKQSLLSLNNFEGKLNIIKDYLT